MRCKVCENAILTPVPPLQWLHANDLCEGCAYAVLNIINWTTIHTRPHYERLEAAVLWEMEMGGIVMRPRDIHA